MERIQQLIQHLKLLPHPEGGYYIETYRSKETIAKAALPGRFGGDRNFSTAIYFLIPAGQFSAFHRIEADELWHFYEGQTLYVYVIHRQGNLEIIRLGNDIEQGEVFQAMVPAGSYFASRPSENEGYSLVGCTVAPGFDFEDFELSDKKELQKLYPQHNDLIEELCRD
jgi:uncharacterized protein